MTKYNKKYYEENKIVYAARNRKWRQSHKTEVATRIRKWYNENKEYCRMGNRERGRKFRRTHPDYSIRLYTDRKQQLMEIIGHVCVRCGFSDPRALQIDHINGGGAREIKSVGYLRHIIKLLELDHDEVKKRVQILCANCNWIKRHENGERGGRTPVS